jgi:EmrB/QacA subfamily drug resistance transporter
MRHNDSDARCRSSVLGRVATTGDPAVMRGSGGKSARLVLVAMILANGMILVDQTAVPLTLPAIMKQFGIGTESAQWVLNASLLPLAGFVVLGGRLGDLVGRRRIFIFGAVLFTSASLAGGLAPTFSLLLAARAVQGFGGAMMLPGTVAIVSTTFSISQQGRALGTMGGVAAVAGALGPTIGGVLTSVSSWRLVLLVNVPLAVLCVVATLAAVPRDRPRSERAHIDVFGAALLFLAIVGLVFGLTETQSESFLSPAVLGALLLSVVSMAVFVWRERRARDPLTNLSLLRRTPNYLGSTFSQGFAAMAEMGLGLLLPLLLILNLGMSPAQAGLALIPTTVPMVALATPAGRWYDRSGGRSPLVVGFVILGISGLALLLGIHANSYVNSEWTSYVELLPGLLLFGTGLAVVLTVNDPVSLDSIAEDDHGQASGVSATAEQAGGAIGIAALYALFHAVYVGRLHYLITTGPMRDLTRQQYEALGSALQAAEQTGLRPKHFDQSLEGYLHPAYAASDRGYAAALLAVTVISAIGAAVSALLVRRPHGSNERDPVVETTTD